MRARVENVLRLHTETDKLLRTYNTADYDALESSVTY